MQTISEAVFVKAKTALKIRNGFGEELAEILEGIVYVGLLDRETDEYFARDGMGRPFLVAELDASDELVIEPDFEQVFF